MENKQIQGTGLGNIPNQLHRIITKSGVNFNIILVGQSSSGKSTFLNTLLTFDLLKKTQRDVDDPTTITVNHVEVVEKNFHVDLRVVETVGFGDLINNEKSWTPVLDYIKDCHLRYLQAESKHDRKNVVDSRPHVCLYFIEPTGHTLSQLDTLAMKDIGEKVNLIPIISKADLLTKSELENFRANIQSVIQSQNIRVYNEDDEAYMESMPFSVIASMNMNKRVYPWGTVHVENEKHCDFVKLRQILVSFYEELRVGVLNGDKENVTLVSTAKSYKEKEAQLRAKFNEKVRIEEERFKDWEKKLIGERDKLNKSLEAEHNELKKLQDEVNRLVMKREKK